MRRATCSCVRPARARASISAAARENSSSSASYSRRYFGFFIHFLWRSSTFVRLIDPEPPGLFATRCGVPSELRPSPFHPLFTPFHLYTFDFSQGTAAYDVAMRGRLTVVVKYDNIGLSMAETRKTRPVSWIKAALRDFESFPRALRAYYWVRLQSQRRAERRTSPNPYTVSVLACWRSPSGTAATPFASSMLSNSRMRFG